MIRQNRCSVTLTYHGLHRIEGRFTSSENTTRIHCIFATPQSDASNWRIHLMLYLCYLFQTWRNHCIYRHNFISFASPNPTPSRRSRNASEMKKYATSKNRNTSELPNFSVPTRTEATTSMSHCAANTITYLPAHEKTIWPYRSHSHALTTGAKKNTTRRTFEGKLLQQMKIDDANVKK